VVLSVGLSFASVFGALLLINFVKLKYRRRKHSKKIAKLSNKIPLLDNPDAYISQLFSRSPEFDFEDIEMMTAKTTREEVDDEESHQNYLISSFNAFEPTIPSISVNSNDHLSTNGIIYTQKKHFRAHTVI